MTDGSHLIPRPLTDGEIGALKRYHIACASQLGFIGRREDAKWHHERAEEFEKILEGE